MTAQLYTVVPEKVLYHFDEPMLFVSKVGSFHSLFLRTDDDDDLECAEFLSCYIDQRHLEALEEGRLSVRGVFEAQSDVYLLWADREYNVRSEKSVTLDKVAGKLPERNVGLFSHYGECPDVIEEKDALLSIYFRGAELRRDHIPYATLMRLLQDVQNVVRSLVLPPQLRGMRSSTVDFLVGDPALGSLMVSIKEPTVNLVTINRNRQDGRKLTELDIARATERSKEDFVSILSELVEAPHAYRMGLDGKTEDDVYTLLRALLPSEDTPFSDVTISTRSGQLNKKVSISRAKADAVRKSLGESNAPVREVEGAIIEINSASGTALVKTIWGRVVTCAFINELFVGLRADRRFKLGVRVVVTGEYIDRVRRDYMNVGKLIFIGDDWDTDEI